MGASGVGRTFAADRLAATANGETHVMPRTRAMDNFKLTSRITVALPARMMPGCRSKALESTVLTL